MTRLHVLDPHPAGSPAVLLLHGLGANGSMWTLQFDDLIAAGYRPLAPDAPGFGASPYDGRGWNFRRVAADLAGLLHELDTGPAHVVGLSMGGVIAQQFALDFPHLTRKLVLVSTFSVLRPGSLSQWLYFLQRLLVVHLVGLQQQSNLVARRVFPAPEQEALREMAAAQIARADPRAYRAAMRQLGLFDSRRRLKEIRVPTLVVTGGRDTTVSPARQTLLANAIPGARQVILSEGGHALAVDQAAAFNRVLLDFLA
ncbi:MAG: alpha/beta hydrolase [Anaerolineales bacterium]|nr:alpha/beta hydrolase [Anaerolineales bacterium]MDW8278235.1 alpha/beta fold hydrolase [Anaerolineales bacterium]